MSSLEEIGSLLGLLAFAGLAVLVFLTFQQARHIRRLRDWAGRAPERAAAAAAREGGMDQDAEEEPLEEEEEATLAAMAGDRGPRFAAARERLGRGWAQFDRRMPVEPKLLVGGLVAVFAGVAIATGAFGLLGDGETVREPDRVESGDGGGQGGGDGGGREREPRPPRVAVLNGTAPPGGTGVPGVADKFGADVEAAGFRLGAVDNAGSYPTTLVMYSPGSEEVAEEVADALAPTLGSPTVQEMTPEIEAVARNADVAVVVGQDNAAT